MSVLAELSNLCQFRGGTMQNREKGDDGKKNEEGEHDF